MKDMSWLESILFRWIFVHKPTSLLASEGDYEWQAVHLIGPFFILKEVRKKSPQKGSV